jgi:hypothetical protein
LAIDQAGVLYITSHEDGKIIRLSQDGTSSIYASAPGKVTGITFAPDGKLLITGWNAEQVSVISQISPDGTVETVATLPDALFLNGITHLSNDRYLIADSYKGVIWEFDAAQQKTRIWLEHPLLTRKSAEDPIPAVNGLKFFAGKLYASNTNRMLMLQIPIDAQGEAGEPSTLAEHVNIDDFAFDTEGNLYGATHIYNSVIRLAPNGQITTIAQAAQGMTGSTAVAFGHTNGDRTALYVVTNGGMFLPPPTGVEPAYVVQLQIGKPGAISD